MTQHRFGLKSSHLHHTYTLRFSRLGPVSLTVFHCNSNSVEILFHCHLNSNAVMDTKFCTWHDSCDAWHVQKICCGLMAGSGITPSFHRIWIAGKKNFSETGPWYGKWTLAFKVFLAIVTNNSKEFGHSACNVSELQSPDLRQMYILGFSHLVWQSGSLILTFKVTWPFRLQETAFNAASVHWSRMAKWCYTSQMSSCAICHNLTHWDRD